MRWIFRLLGLVAALCVLAVLAIFLLPSDRIAQVAVAQIEAQTGREVTLEPGTQLSLYPVLGVSTGAVSIANADWSANGPFLQADHLKVGVSFAALLRGEIKITGLEADRPQILLERTPDGRANWELGVDGVAASADAPSVVSEGRNALALSLDRALISGGMLRYLDAAGGTDVQVTDLGLDLRWPAYRGAASFAVQGRLTEAGGISLNGEVSDLAALIEGQIVELQLDASLPGGTAAFSGRAGLPAQVQGAVSVDFEDTTRVLAAVGVAGVALPEGAGRKLSLSSDITLTQAQQFSLRGLELRADQNRITGAVDVDLAQQPLKLSARLDAGDLVVPMAAGPAASAPQAAGAGWPQTPIDAGGLAALNAEVLLTANRVNLGPASLGAAQVRATLDRSRLVLGLEKLAAYSGSVSGQLVANNRSGLSVGGDLSVSDIALGDVMQMLIGTDRFTGAANAQVQFLGVGQSVDAIMRSLSGDGALSMGHGTISGFDLDALMRGGDASGGTTVFDALSASFTMEKGNLFNPDLLLELPIVSATGEGRIGLGAQDIDYLFTPKAGNADARAGVSIPVRIKGPWSNPRAWPDLKKAIDLNLRAEKEAAQEKLETRVSEELGLDKQAEESLEDAAKRKLEEELTKGLGKIFR